MTMNPLKLTFEEASIVYGALQDHWQKCSDLTKLDSRYYSSDIAFYEGRLGQINRILQALREAFPGIR